MLASQEIAWCVYAALFLFFSIFLICRCRHNLLLVPFAIFGMLMTVGNICLLSAQYSSTTAASISSTFWINKSLALSVLPAASVLVFFGIMEAQLIFIRHITTAISNRDHWGSLYLRDPEKKINISNKKQSSVRPWTYYTSLASLSIYTLLAISTIVILAVASGPEKDLGTALCVTLMLLVVCFDTAVLISYTRSTNQVRLIRRNHNDVFFLQATPILFSICMAGVVTLSWIHYFALDVIALSLWIVIESLAVYLPLVGILIMCIHTGKIKKMGRQYRVETEQRSFNSNYSYRTVSDIESVTKKISQEESTKLACPPPPAYQPNIHSKSTPSS